MWFFGLPIMDRIFINTGGICDYDDIVNNQSLFNDVGSKACRKLQGIWTGGHDPSGHVFLLVQSSIILWFELLDIRTLAELKKFGDNYQGKRQWKERALLIASSSIIVLFALLTLWWFMLLITSIHFHSFPEKLTGLFFSYLPILFYLVPRYFNL
ncbi:hypothetical protein WICMUC_000488 [Wickerhamomyces mucosus]|uniref:FIT family protein scs3 n=1 Tax=Wickerhamomyces mucosus TaxID=1378264 RepID=A0A9P8THX5_9ASCO|nr:hypothetical protein WICMUC_000488 [Wickerhamomyces mucosus]